jgi:hypothetical protein
MTIEITRFNADFPMHRQVLSGAPLGSTTTGTAAAATFPQIWKLRVIGETQVTWTGSIIERFGDGHLELRFIPAGLGITAVT